MSCLYNELRYTLLKMWNSSHSPLTIALPLKYEGSVSRLVKQIYITERMIAKRKKEANLPNRDFTKLSTVFPA